MQKINAYKNELNAFDQESESLEYAEKVRKDMVVPQKISLKVGSKDIQTDNDEDAIYSRASDMNIPEHLSIADTVKNVSVENDENINVSPKIFTKKKHFLNSSNYIFSNGGDSIPLIQNNMYSTTPTNPSPAQRLELLELKYNENNQWLYNTLPNTCFFSSVFSSYSVDLGKNPKR
ncbi:unnamed protein product [Gordionus sp. m RMFG-2023]